MQQLSQNYFELFGMQPTFHLDLETLAQTQTRLQASFHPDRYVNASERERRLSVQMMALINEAGKTLKNPVSRGAYLLEMNGVELADDSATTADTSFLMEQMELREQMEACRHADDGADKCDVIAQQLKQRLKDIAADFSDSFAAGDWQKAQDLNRKMQFVQRLQQQVAELQFELEEF